MEIQIIINNSLIGVIVITLGILYFFARMFPEVSGYNKKGFPQCLI